MTAQIFVKPGYKSKYISASSADWESVMLGSEGC